jgi:hypothetical protein
MTGIIFKLAPAGINFNSRKNWVLQRRSGRDIRNFIAGLADVHRLEPAVFLDLARAYIAGLEQSLHDCPLGRPLCRLARAYAAKYHRQLVADLALHRMAVRHLLLVGGTSCQAS